jgi:hypothetical protein
MLKEIYEQPEAIQQTISQALNGNALREDFLQMQLLIFQNSANPNHCLRDQLPCRDDCQILV